MCKFNGCKPLYIDAVGANGRKKGGKITLFGRASDIDIVKYLFAYLSLEIERLAKENTRKQNLSRGAAKGYSNAYKIGAIQGIHEQLKAAQSQVRESATTTALAVVDKRKDDAEQYMRTIYKNTRAGQASKFSNAQGFIDGKRAGKNIHLGKSLDGKTKALPQ